MSQFFQPLLLPACWVVELFFFSSNRSIFWKWKLPITIRRLLGEWLLPLLEADYYKIQFTIIIISEIGSSFFKSLQFLKKSYHKKRLTCLGLKQCIVHSYRFWQFYAHETTAEKFIKLLFSAPIVNNGNIHSTNYQLSYDL